MFAAMHSPSSGLRPPSPRTRGEVLPALGKNRTSRQSIVGNTQTERREVMKITRALLVSLLLLSAVSLHADEDCYASATLKNKTGRSLMLSKANLKWGKWCVGPPIEIKNGAEALFTACGRSGTWSGTEGELAYSLEGASDSRITFSFDISYNGKAKGWVG